MHCSMCNVPQIPSPSSDRLDELSEDAFLDGWKRLVGEPPAAVLGSRRAMIELLVATSGVAPDPVEVNRGVKGVTGRHPGRRGDDAAG